MNAAVYLILIALAAGALAVALSPLIKAWWNARGARRATCPETQEAAAKEVNPVVDPVDAAFHALLKIPEIHLQSCSRWPEKAAGCGQACLAGIAAAPNGCLVRNVLAEWYEGKPCAVCGKELCLESGTHQPALMSPERVTSEWADVDVEDLPEILAAWRPVCWDCHVVETLYRLHPEVITGRARQRGR